MSPPKSVRTQFEGGSPLKSIKVIKCPDSAKQDYVEIMEEDATPVVLVSDEDQKILECDDLDYQLSVYDKYETNRMKWQAQLDERVLETISEQQSNFEATSRDFQSGFLKGLTSFKNTSFNNETQLTKIKEENPIQETSEEFKPKTSKLASYFDRKKSAAKSRQDDLSPLKNRKRNLL